MTVSLSIDHVHLLHHLVVSQIGISLGDAWVVERKIRQTVSTSIQPAKRSDLRFAEVAIAVENHDIATGLGIRVGKITGSGHPGL